MSDSESDDIPQETNIDPYEILEVDRKATADQIKSAYRKQALKTHPDKVSGSDAEKQAAKEKFQQVALAYAVLSDSVRRKRYDATGDTSETLSSSDFSWTDFYAEQFRDAVSEDAINKFAEKYKKSDEEKDDLLVAYEKHKGNMDRIYEEVMLSNVLEDDERFRSIIDEAIASKDVKAFKAYTNESKKSKDARIKTAKGEATEAEEYAKELGVHDKLFNNKKGKKSKKDPEADLAALIQRNQKSREGFLDNLAAKYGGGMSDMPSEEEFQAASKKLGKRKSPADDNPKSSRGGRSQDDTFFHLNHPIRWVRVVGLVVAIDSFYGRRVYTVDDSTGVCIECTVGLPPSTQASGERAREDVEKAAGADQNADLNANLYAAIDVGMVVDVKGNLKLFRDQKQIKIQKMQHVRSTSQEVEFWNKIRDFKSDVLSKPWVLDRKILRRLGKENRTDVVSKEKERRQRKRKEEAEQEDANRRRSRSGPAYGNSGLKKAYRPSKLSSVTTVEEGQFDALGL
ncbi:DnaJ-like protein subfamily C member 9 [Seiridium cupressi]